MDKRALRKIPVMKATNRIFMLAETHWPREECSPDVICSATFSGEAEDRVLVLHFYLIKDLVRGDISPVMRTLMVHDDYITQDLRTDKAKWLTGGFDNFDYNSPIGWGVVGIYFPKGNSKIVEYPRVIFASRSERMLAAGFFGGEAETDDLHFWKLVGDWQDKIRYERLEEKKGRELARTDEVMGTIDPVPEEFTQWVMDEGMEDSRYLAFVPEGKNKAQCQCTHCGGKGTIDRREFKFRDGEWTTCPFCGSRVKARARRRMARHFYDSCYFMYIDPRPAEGAFWVRIFFAYRDYTNEGVSYDDLISFSEVRVKEDMKEVRRAYYTFPAKGAMHYYPYEWGYYKHRGNPRWCPGVEEQPCWINYLYTGNLPEAWGDTPLKYCSLDILAKDEHTVVRYEDAFNTYLHFPKLEWILKMGLTHLAADILGRGTFSVNKAGKTIYDILGISKPYVRILQELNGGSSVLSLLQTFEKLGMYTTAEEVGEYFEVFDSNDDFIPKESRPVSIHKLCRYIRTESRKFPCNRNLHIGTSYDDRSKNKVKIDNMVHDWRDYLRWCLALGYDTSDKYWFMPNNFIPVHDRIYKEFLDMQEKKDREKKRREARRMAKRSREVKAAMAELLGENTEATGIALRGKGLMIVVPDGRDDLVAEGEALHHCVATYADRVSRGETSIFFVRKEKEPEKPYFTMEYKNGKVQQCRGDHNCGMPANVEAFVNVFQAKMDAAMANVQRKAVI